METRDVLKLMLAVHIKYSEACHISTRKNNAQIPRNKEKSTIANDVLNRKGWSKHQ